eukprot:TRINITY_DN9708_c0_g1_i4.p1 TRINITY_DN9708_c0_g1~~TRINITY_DN9708_c0_g1_i4.p1  ORF type:complete len:261 (+),score=71.03 TRINITY_DN9708_c0_g1_i4:100-882(+)
MLRSLVGSEMCIRDSINAEYGERSAVHNGTSVVMNPEARWLLLTCLATAGFLAAHFQTIPGDLAIRLDAASRTALAAVLLRNAPTVAAVHCYGQTNALFSLSLALGFLGAGLVRLDMDEEKAPISAVYVTVLNISMICWSFGLLMGIAKLGGGMLAGRRVLIMVRVMTVLARGSLFCGLMAIQWWLSTVHPPDAKLKVVMVLLQFLTVATTFIETHTLSDTLTRHARGEVRDESDLVDMTISPMRKDPENQMFIDSHWSA